MKSQPQNSDKKETTVNLIKKNLTEAENNVMHFRIYDRMNELIVFNLVETNGY
jgi:hypothetical protein